MIKAIEGGLLGSNTYVVYNEAGKTAMIVDCGCPSRHAIDFINKMGLRVEHIVLTHGHFDHAHYIDEYASAFPEADIICHRDEIQVLYDPDGNLSTFMGAGKCYDQPYKTVRDGDKITLSATDENDSISFKIIHSPGHTPGSMCILCEERGVMLTGDVLFASGYGRVDFKYGSATDMMSSLNRLFLLDGEIIFYPGHGGSSKIKYER